MFNRFLPISMKKLFAVLLLVLLISSKIKAQAPTYTVTDPNFLAFLNTNFPQCMTGNVITTTCAIMAITWPATINVSGLGISNLWGIQAFCSTDFVCLNCSNNLLTSLPPLTTYYGFTLICNNNSLTALPNISGNNVYHIINCENNLITNISPNILAYDVKLYCGNNNITCFPAFSQLSQTLSLLPNPALCLANYVPAAMDPTLLAMPICTAGNIYNCPGTNVIAGNNYKDVNINCVKDNADINLRGVPVQLYDNTGFVAQYYSSASPAYVFNVQPGTYTVVVDTTFAPIVPQCPAPGVDSANIVISLGTPYINNVNFNLNCLPGFDFGCNSFRLEGPIFPGLLHGMWIFAGNKGYLGDLNCGGGGGQVVVQVSGPASIMGPAPYPGVLVPLISGNTATYSVADFNSVNYNSFLLANYTATSAVIGNLISVSVVVTPTAGDNRLSNNTYTFCYPVGNSYDPNEKQVYPVDVLPGFQDWFTYTIDFQNLGNAPAYNIRVLDTLDTNLDLGTFQVIENSHPFNVALNGNVANFFFPGIMLPDNISDPQGSKGFIQYRVKPKPGLPNGTKIKNRGHIYFDYNPAVVTNQTINNFIFDLGKEELKKESSLNLYPNPAKSKLTILFTDAHQRALIITDLMGKEVFNKIVDDKKTEIVTDQIQTGIYFLKIVADSKISVHKIIIEK